MGDPFGGKRRDAEEESDEGEDFCRVPEIHSAARGEFVEHGEQHDPDDVIEDGGADDYLRFVGGVPFQVAQNPERDPDAGGGEGAADEQAGKERKAEGVVADQKAARKGKNDAQDRHRDRFQACGREAGDIGLNPYFEKQQDDPDLSEQVDWDRSLNPAEQARADEDACCDLSDDGRDVQPVRRFADDARRDQDQDELEDKIVDVHNSAP